MKIWASAVVLVAASLLLVSPWIWRQAGGAQARAGTHEMMALAPRSAAPTRTPEPTPAAPAPLVHRQSVLENFSCSDCHGVDRGFVVPADHATMAEADCQNCHKPIAAPSPIALHDNMSVMSVRMAPEDCGLCHKAFPAQLQPAALSQGACFRCHRDETDKVFPASHVGRSDATSTCVVCHQSQQLTVPVVPHRTAGWEECTFCHGPQRLTPLTGAHAYQRNELCLTCHSVVQPPGISQKTHTPATQTQGCTSCHAADAVAPLPASHDGRAEVLCGLCHQPAGTDPPAIPELRPDVPLSQSRPAGVALYPYRLRPGRQ